MATFMDKFFGPKQDPMSYNGDSGIVQQMQYKIDREKERISLLYYEIGRSCFERHGKEENHEFQDCFNQIHEIQNNIERMKDAMAVFNTNRICPTCGASNGPNNVFCVSCGQSLNEADHRGTMQEAPRPMATAPSMAVTPTMPSMAPTSPMTEAPKATYHDFYMPEEPVAQRMTTENPRAYAVERRCKSCGEPLEEGAIFCIQCGTRNDA